MPACIAVYIVCVREYGSEFLIQTETKRSIYHERKSKSNAGRVREPFHK